MKTIQATITIEVPYSNEYINYGDKLDKELRRVIDNTPFLNCSLVAGENLNNNGAVIRDTSLKDDSLVNILYSNKND